MDLLLPIALGVMLLGACALALQQFLRARSLRKRFEPIVNEEEEIERLNSEKTLLKSQVTSQRKAWESEIKRTIVELESLSSQVTSVSDQVELESFGMYEPHFGFDTSEKYKAKIKEIRDRQKQMIKEKTAAVCDTEWTVEGSKAKGKQMVQRYLKLQLRAFNGEADAAIAKARFNNVVKLEERLEKSFQAINKLGETNQCRITSSYLNLKVDELRAAYEHARKKEDEKEEQRRIREEMKEAEAAERELQKAQKEAEKEEKRFEVALAKARAEAAAAGDAMRDSLRKKIELLENQLNTAHEQKAKAISRAQLTRSGHVYVISNIGSFGEEVYKIGMTRRLEPLDRVKELGDASVPFRFDVHAMIYSEDAPTLESDLQKRFADQQVNMVNPRKEFFRVALDDVEAAVLELCGDEVEFIRTAVAEEFRESKAILQRLEQEKAHAAQKMQDAAVAHAKSRFEELKQGWKAEAI